MNQAAHIGITLGSDEMDVGAFFFKASLTSFGVTTYEERAYPLRCTDICHDWTETGLAELRVKRLLRAMAPVEMVKDFPSSRAS